MVWNYLPFEQGSIAQLVSHLTADPGGRQAWIQTRPFDPCAAEPGYTLPLKTVDPDQLASSEL